jgi:hypothetical protein
MDGGGGGGSGARSLGAAGGIGPSSPAAGGAGGMHIEERPVRVRTIGSRGRCFEEKNSPNPEARTHPRAAHHLSVPRVRVFPPGKPRKVAREERTEAARMSQFSDLEAGDLETGADDLAFEARTDDGRRLTNMLSSICLSSNKANASATLAWCEVTDHQITFTVGVAKSLQAVAYVRREGVFMQWDLAEHHRGDKPVERLEFGINLATLLECLRIFGGASVGGGGHAFESKAQLHINYRTSTACLNLCLVEGCVTDPAPCAHL